MKLRKQFGGLRLWLSATLGFALLFALAGPPAFGAGARQKPKERSNNRPPAARNDRPPANSNATPNRDTVFNGATPVNPNRPPGAGKTSPQERWRNMTPQERQRLKQNEENLQRLPPAQRQVMRDRAQVWQRMTPEQRDHIRNDVLPRWRTMSPDRRQAIQQRLRVLQNMPEGARNRRLNDPNFTRGMTDEDRSTLRDLSHLHVGGAPEPPGE